MTGRGNSWIPRVRLDHEFSSEVHYQERTGKLLRIQLHPRPVLGSFRRVRTFDGTNLLDQRSEKSEQNLSLQPLQTLREEEG